MHRDTLLGNHFEIGHLRNIEADAREILEWFLWKYIRRKYANCERVERKKPTSTPNARIRRLRLRYHY
jgi:hypothetical protein